jgi:uncharacterized protein with HEPN domain
VRGSGCCAKPFRYDERRIASATRDYLLHMLEAARLAREYVENTVKADFLNDRRTQQAVVLNLITIGEAASRIVSDHSDFAAAHSEIPWAQMRGMRNRMAHGYFDIDLNIVWDTLKSSLPELERQLLPLVSQPTS